MNIYYAQEAFANHYNNGTYATSIDELTDLLDEEIIRPFDIRIHPTNKTGGGGSGGYYATVSGNPDGSTVRIANDRLLQVIAQIYNIIRDKQTLIQSENNDSVNPCPFLVVYITFDGMYCRD